MMPELNPEFFFNYLLPIELRPDQFTYFRSNANYRMV